MAYKDIVLADSPIVYYRLDDAGPTAVNSGTGGSTYNATIGSSITAGAAGLLVGDADKAVSFPQYSSGAYSAAYSITTGRQTGIEFTSSFSIEFLFNASTLLSGGSLISYTSSIGNGGYGISTYSRSGFQYLSFFNVMNGQQFNTYVGSVALVTGTTYHVVLSYDGSANTATAYINNKAYSLYIYAGTAHSYGTSSALYIGSSASSSSSSGYVDAMVVDEVSIYGTALTAAQVAKHYNASQNIVAALRRRACVEEWFH